MPTAPASYFSFVIQLSARAWQVCRIEELLAATSAHSYPRILLFRRLAQACQKSGFTKIPASAAQLNLYATLLQVYRHLIDEVAVTVESAPLLDALFRAGIVQDDPEFSEVTRRFVELFPPDAGFMAEDSEARHHGFARELLLLGLSAENRALDQFRELMDDHELASSSAYPEILNRLELSMAKAPAIPALDMNLLEALKAPLRRAPGSLAGQIGYIRENWAKLIPGELLEELLFAFDLYEEAERQRWSGGAGPSQVLEFGVGHGGTPGEGFDPGHVAGYDQPEYEAFSPDADWMSNVVLIAKMTYVWLHQLTLEYGYPIKTLDQIPDAELDRMAARGFSALWLIGVWERSPASKRIKELCGNSDAIASAYSLFDYLIAADLGGEPAFLNLKERAAKRGIRLASDMVPNHTGIYSRWVIEHPDWFVQSDHPPFPTYRYNGEDLSHDPAVTIQIEDGYWSKDDAAVTFRMIDRRDGKTRYIYHGNDGTSIPWNDTAQLNYLIPAVREAVINTILHVARLTPIIRFDAAMTLAKKHYQRLWYPQRGLGGGIPSRAEHAMSREEFDTVFPNEFWREVVDRVAKDAAGTLLLAEAFWMMEGYFVRTLGMHRVYNSAFMNMIKTEENAKYRQTIRNVLEFNPEVLKRFVNFMNNPDEKTAVEQFGSQGKYFGACLLLATMPGLPMFGHGQVEGYREKYGMEYYRPYWDESVDQGLLNGHEMWIFPLIRQRWLFSGSERFELYDFYCYDGAVDENVFAYTNSNGDHRALVLFHNRHAHTAGWIKESCQRASKSDDGNTVLLRSDLAVALSLPSGKDDFVAFKDLISGLEYLRSCKEIHEKGIYAELGEYEFHVFSGFRLLTDNQEAGWAGLSDRLAGRGVDNLEEELLEIKHHSLIAAFEMLLSILAAPDITRPVKDELAEQVTLFGNRLSARGWRISPIQTSLLATAFELPKMKKSLRWIRKLGISRKVLPCSRIHRRLQIAIMLLGALNGALPDNGIKSCGLARPLAGFITGSKLRDRQAAEWYAGLSEAVAHAWNIWNSKDADTDSARLRLLFNHILVSRFLLVHEDNGVLWFNKERFELLVRWMAVQGAFAGAADLVAVPLPSEWLNELAGVAGYRVERLIRLVQAG
jgi:glycosidase